MGEWKSQMGFIHLMEYRSAVKRNGVLTHAPKWMHLKTLKLNKRKGQEKRSHGVGFHVDEIPEQTESRLVSRGNGSYYLMGTEVYLGVMKMFWNLIKKW